MFAKQAHVEPPKRLQLRSQPQPLTYSLLTAHDLVKDGRRLCRWLARIEGIIMMWLWLWLQWKRQMLCWRWRWRRRRRQPFGRGYINIFIFVWHRNVAGWHIYQKMPYWHLQATWSGLAVQQWFFILLSTSSSKLINFICCQERLFGAHCRLWASRRGDFSIRNFISIYWIEKWLKD